MQAAEKILNVIYYIRNKAIKTAFPWVVMHVSHYVLGKMIDCRQKHHHLRPPRSPLASKYARAFSDFLTSTSAYFNIMWLLVASNKYQ